MLVSVTERTREIGIRLAIGALGREVLMQFLIEALMLGCLGGILGVLAALGASRLFCTLMNVPFVFDPGINLLAFTVSALTGVVFGFFPARRAAKSAGAAGFSRRKTVPPGRRRRPPPAPP